MSDQLSAQDWLDRGLKALAAKGAGALKAELLAKSMGVSRGSFYWHFADIAAFRTAILAHWREVSAERVIADLEVAAEHGKSVAAFVAPHILQSLDARESGAELGDFRCRGANCRAGNRPAAHGLY